MTYEELYDKCKSLEDKLIKCDYKKMELQQQKEELIDVCEKILNATTKGGWIEKKLSPVLKKIKKESKLKNL